MKLYNTKGEISTSYNYKAIWNITVPMMLMLLAQTAVQIMGTIFISDVGLAEQKAVTMAGIFYIAFFTICFGFSVGGQIMISRRNGEGNFGAIGEIVIQGTLFLLLMAMVLYLLCDYVLYHILGNYMDEADVYGFMKEYLSYRMLGFFLSSINVMYRAFYVGVARTPVLTYNAILMTAVNILLDYVLIFGKFGFPEMGVKGAGIAAIAAEFTAIFFFSIYTYSTIDFKKYGFHKMKFRPRIIKRILKISSFTMVQNVISMGTWFLFFMFVQHKTVLQFQAGVEHPEDGLGITSVVRTFYMIFFIPLGAFATSANTLVGNTMGKGNIKDVIPLIKRICILSVGMSMIIMLVILYAPEYWIALFLQKTPEMVPEVLPALKVVLAALPILSISGITFSAISGTGNTKGALILELAALVAYSVYMYWIVLVQQASTAACWTVEYVYWGSILIASVLYLKYAKWQNKKV